MNFIFCLLISLSFPDKNKEIETVPLPFDSISQKIIIDSTIQINPIIREDSIIDSVKQEQVCKRALNWYNDYFDNPRKVIHTNACPERIKGTHKVRIYDYDLKKKKQTSIIRFWLIYDIEIICKNGEFTYIINNFQIDGHKRIPFEKLLNDDGSPKEYQNVYTNQLAVYLKKIEDSIIENMKLIDKNE